MNSTITLKEYLAKGKIFVIPDYQRGYIWGKEVKGKTDSVTFLMDSLIKGSQNNADVFLQGITVTEKENDTKIILIDGQQRTTCLYLLMKYLGYGKDIKIEYSIRKKSNDYLKEKWDLENIKEEDNEEFQDIYFFKKSLRLIREKITKAGVIDKKTFCDYLLEHVKFLYINIPEEKATTVFTMMNGNKAEMLPEEIIKAELLRLASLNLQDQDKLTSNEQYAVEWDKNMLRSRYAREWDKWLYWWNRNEVKDLFKCSNPMGLLISTYLQQKKKEILTFELFKNTCFNNSSEKDAKDTFDGLRRLQKRFEDAFNNPITHNKIGAILRIFDKDNPQRFIQYYFAEDHRDNLDNYYKCTFLGMTHEEINAHIEKNKKQKKESHSEDDQKRNGKEDKFEEKYQTTLDAISDDFLYENNPEAAFELLLRLNVDEDNKQNRRFNFEIWKERSLEHIYPKSKVYHKDENGNWFTGNGDNLSEEPTTKDFLNRENIKTRSETTTEHSIGNLVLLYKNENSEFSNKSFEEKKVMFFSPNRVEFFKSRSLLHTICVFAEKKDWTGKEIADNKIYIINQFTKYYEPIQGIL